MRCKCEACNGSGRVECEDCAGEGSTEFELLKMHLWTGQTGYAAARECQKAARTVAAQAEELSVIFPRNKHLYEEQAKAILQDLADEAQKALEENPRRKRRQ